MSFLVDINPEMELPKYKLTLHKLNEEPLTSLKNIKNLSISPLFVGIDNLTFDVPLHIMNNDGTNSRNMIYDMIEGDHLVKLNNMSYFIITNVKEFADDDGSKYKIVQCKSREYELIRKKLIDYKADSRVLYSKPNVIDDDGLELGILNHIFKHLTRSWTLGYVDPDLILREGRGIYRALSFDNSNLIQVFVELQKTFNCIFTFDSVNRKVNVYDINNKMGQDRGLYISDTNFIKSITKDVNSENIITRLYLRGKDGISIQSISPTGQPYIDNFDYYKNTKYMSQGLIDALDNYKVKVDEYDGKFKVLIDDLYKANTAMEKLLNDDGSDLSKMGSVALNRELKKVQGLVDVKVGELGIISDTINKADGLELSDLHATKKEIQNEMDSLILNKDNIVELIKLNDAKVEAQQLIIDNIDLDVKSLQGKLRFDDMSGITRNQLIELDNFIKMETFNDSNYTEHNLDELREEGIRQLDRLSQPPIQFEVDVVDFLNLVECQHIWKNFVLGDVVTLEHKEMGFKFRVRLVGYEHNIDDNELNLKFSNTNSFDDATLYERDLMEHIGNVGTAVDFNSDKWNDVGNVESRIAKLVDSKLEEARQNILNAVGQQHLFGDDGLWLYKENPDGTIDDEQIRAINNTIALTDDNWATPPGVAITPQGIVAERIYGKLGEFAKLSATQIVAGNKGELIPENLVDGFPQVKDQINAVESDFRVANDSITARMTGVETDTVELTGRISTAENKITPGAITNTVESTTTALATNSALNTVRNTANVANSNASTAITNASSAIQTANSVSYNFTQLKNLSTGQELSGGRTTIDRDGIKVTHTGLGGQYSEMRADGFIRKWKHGEAQYLNDIYASRNATITIDGSYNGDPPYENWTYYYKPNPVKILLPDRFVGRKVECFLSLIGYYSGGGAMGHSVTLNFETPINETTKGEHPYVEVCGYVTSKNSYQYFGPEYFGLDFQLLVIGK